MNLSRRLCIFGIAIFSILGPLCIYFSIQKFHTAWVTESFSNILRDPIYFYAVLDLGSIFSIISYWTYLECKRQGRTFWPWPIVFFVFGTPAFLIFLLNQKSSSQRYSVIFTSKRKPEASGYDSMAEQMVTLASKQPGFLGIESVRDESGLGITVSYWNSCEAIRNWKMNTDHQVAQKFGKEKWYDHYTVAIAKVEREYGSSSKN